MIKWLRRIFEKIFSKKIKMLEASKEKNFIDNKKNDFRISLKQEADPEQEDGSGYKIVKRLNLEDMI